MQSTAKRTGRRIRITRGVPQPGNTMFCGPLSKEQHIWLIMRQDPDLKDTYTNSEQVLFAALMQKLSGEEQTIVKPHILDECLAFMDSTH